MSVSEVILTENFPLLGFVGDKVRVRRGYARNFLIPQGIAVEASSRRANEVSHVVAGIMAKRNRLKKEAEQLALRMAQQTLEFTLTAARKGKAFGSVSVREIFEKLAAAGYELDRKQVRLRETIRGAGNYIADVRLHAEVTAEVPVLVVVNIVAEKEESPKAKKRGKASRDEAAHSDSSIEEEASPALDEE